MFVLFTKVSTHYAFHQKQTVKNFKESQKKNIMTTETE